MAASATDLFQEVGLATATTLDANYTINDATVTVVSTSGMPTATGITFAIDVIDSNGVQVPGSYNEFVGTVASATSLASVDWVGGTADRNYSAGATTRVYIPVSAERENRLVEGILEEHNQDGTHAAITATSVATDTITEDTGAAGVTIDGLLIKDSKLATNDSVVTANITAGNVTSPKLAEAFFRGRFQENTSNSAPTTQTVQYGWGYIQGDGTALGNKTVTFPAAFSAAPVVFLQFLGVDSSTEPAAITDFVSTIGSGPPAFYASAISTTNFVARFTRSDAVTLANTAWFGFSWIAIGAV